ncbi:MAG TPA: NAD-dependent epimerase/dehydratase family protein [Bacteroidales bacterium]|nr:NAD-dependent epimerase/dehydratase family protein [Bacteroidales bacterium]
MKRSAVVFGATGMVGTALVRELALNNEYERVMAVVRKDTDLHFSKVETLILRDFNNLPDHKRKLGADDYFCCIGTTIKTAGSQDAFKMVDLGIPLRIAEIAQDMSIPNLIVISSVGSDPGSKNFYLRTKGEMEYAVRNKYKGNLKFIRPSLLMGKRNETRFGEKVAISMMKAMGWIFVGPLKKYRGVDAGLVAKAMIKATKLPKEKFYVESNELFSSDI